MKTEREEAIRVTGRKLAALLLSAALLVCGSGCGFFEKEYVYSEPYVDSLDRDTGDAIEVWNYSMLKAAILDMIANHQPSAEFRFNDYRGAVNDDLAAVCLEIKSVNPLGAYAVDSLTYDTSRIVSYYVAEVDITFKRTAEEIRGVHSLTTAQELKTFLLSEVLSVSGERTTIRTYTSLVDEETILKTMETLRFEDPAGIPLPVTAEITSYPNEGGNRIFQIDLGYEYTSARRAMMTEKITERVAEMVAEELPENEAERALRLATALSGGLLDTQEGDFRNSAYGALIDRSADSEGVALAYAALCRAAGLECLVVKGSIGAMGTEEHFWNILTIDGACYHADVSKFDTDPENTFLADDDTLWGTYLWNTDDYPACSGTLCYRDVAPRPEGNAAPDAVSEPAEAEPQEPEAPAETEIPEETEPPAETGEEAP